jgi:hypothetical protein
LKNIIETISGNFDVEIIEQECGDDHLQKKNRRDNQEFGTKRCLKQPPGQASFSFPKKSTPKRLKL